MVKEIDDSEATHTLLCCFFNLNWGGGGVEGVRLEKWKLIVLVYLSWRQLLDIHVAT